MAWGRRKDNNQPYVKTGKKGVSGAGSKTDSVADVHLKENKEQRFKKIAIFNWDEASQELKEKILEKWRNERSGQDSFYAEDEGILYSEDGKIIGYEIFKGNIPKYWNVGYGHEWIQFDLSVKDEKKFEEAFGFTKELLSKISNWDFRNKNETNTELVLYDLDGDEIDLEEPYDEKRFSHIEEKDRRITKVEYEQLQKIHSKFNDLMDQALRNLRRNYEYQFEEESIVEEIKSNEYNFDENGDIA